MTTEQLGACEWFVWDLRRSNLLERGRLDQVVSEFLGIRPGAEPNDLAAYLVEQGILTQFQADSLLAGKSQGLVLGPYVLIDTLGTGSMGTVYKAQSKTNHQLYAVKVLPRRSMWNIRIARRKVRDFEQFQHPSVVPFVDVGTSGSTHYLAWPYVEGEPLSKVVERQGKLSPAEAALVAMQIAEGLEACQQRQVIHGLLKPTNVMIAPDRHVKILDFGVGSLLTETDSESVVDTMSTANTMASGLDCASPESIMDPTTITTASDQYSLGCVLYFCLTGGYPFPGNNAVEKMMAHQTKQPPPITAASPEVPAELVAVVERLMRKNPADRYPSFAQVIAALRPFANLAVQPVAWQPPPPLAVPAPAPAGHGGHGPAPTPRPRLSNLSGSLPTAAAGHGKANGASWSQSKITLPDRRSLERPAAAAPAAPPAAAPTPAPPPPAPTPAPARPVPSAAGLPRRNSGRLASPPPPPRAQGWDDRTTTLVVIVVALVGCVAGWFLASYFM
jgi:serine/threonine-protein kinase